MTFPIIDMKQTGNRISELRARRGMSVKELQGLMGFSTPQAIYKWQHGDTLPSIDNLVALSAIFSVPIEAILVCSGE